MRTKTASLLLFLACMGATALSGWLLATARANSLQRVGGVPAGFTYQGELLIAGRPASGRYDFGFSLWDAPVGGSQVGSTLQQLDVDVAGGRFSTLLDFGDVFDGHELFLQIAVRESGSAGPFTALEPRQRLSATPYAAHAGKVVWSGLLEVPAGFADGIDNDTTYLPGDGLRLSGSRLDVVGMPLPFHEELVVDDTNPSGIDVSMIIGRDGLPLISYHDALNGDLKVAHCADLVCSQATITTLDSEGVTGKHTSITLGRDGQGLISYYDETNSALKLAHCLDLACTSAALATVDDNGSVGQFSSITTNRSGYAFVSYYDAANRNLKVASCNDLPCSDVTIYVVDESGDVGQYTSVTRSADGQQAYISYYDAINGNLMMARCPQMDCSDPANELVDGEGTYAGVEHDAGLHSSMTIAANGVPLVAYTKTSRSSADPAQVRVAQCTSTFCRAFSRSVVMTSLESEWQAVSLTLGPDSYGLITFTSTASNQLYTAHCNNVSCTSQTIVSDTAQSPALDTAVTIGVDGLPLISYSSATEGTLHTIHCSEPACVPYLRRR